ncbi:MAG: hypothetical protein CME65_13420 [Halobacteriovoraceae bacterium]|nr:hypothetical protein [Halobacteriovoraceae bacterium]|tara:strand:+ start:737 stop:1141 length:405 start_codon:yes stop_codon:yes gene_type:complete
MRVLLAILVFTSFQTSVIARGFLPNKIEGRVIDVFIGELDPYIGDYCVITIRDKVTGRLYGLVSDEGPAGPLCDDAELLELDWVVGAYRSKMDFLEDSGLIGALHSYSRFISKEERFFFLSYRKNLVFLGGPEY